MGGGKSWKRQTWKQRGGNEGVCVGGGGVTGFREGEKCPPGAVYVPCIYTHAGESYRWRLRSLLYSCCLFRGKEVEPKSPKSEKMTVCQPLIEPVSLDCIRKVARYFLPVIKLISLVFITDTPQGVESEAISPVYIRLY